MSRLTHADQRCVVDALRELYAQTDLEPLRATMVRLASRLVACDVGSFNEIPRTPGRRLVSLRYPASAEAEKHLPAFVAYFDEHPIARANAAAAIMDARKFSDFVTPRQLHRLRLYNEYYLPTGTHHQMGFWFDRKSGSQRDFSERDRAVLNLLQPHYTQAYENADAFARVRLTAAALEQAQNASGHAMILVDREARITWLSSTARDWLRDFVGVDLDAGAPLPGALQRWLTQRRAERNQLERTSAEPAPPLRFSNRHGTLVIRFASEDVEGNTSLLLHCDRSSATPLFPRFPGITARENEVLTWIAQGKSNPEIAVILGLSVRTVYKHVENIFPKLGVESRAAAMLRALEHMRTPIRTT